MKVLNNKMKISGNLEIENDPGYFDALGFSVSVDKRDKVHHSDVLIVSFDLIDDIMVQWDKYGVFIEFYNHEGIYNKEYLHYAPTD